MPPPGPQSYPSPALELATTISPPSLWFAYNVPAAPGGSPDNDNAVTAVDAFFHAAAFDLAGVLRQERERHAEFY